jgi:hypothetical protein
MKPLKEIKMTKILFAACLLIGIQANAQWGWEKVEGNGQLKKETRTAGAFTKVASSGSWDVMIAYGAENSIQVEGDENLLSYIETKVEDGKLNIRNKKNSNIRSRNKIVVYVILPTLTGVYLSGSGDMIGKGNFSNDGKLSLAVSGSGNIKLEINNAKSVDCSIAGSGKIEVSGKAETLLTSISGSGSVDAYSLYTNEVTARISGSGNAKVFANKTIDASISGSGDVRYKGAPESIQKKTAGSGRVVKSE